ncbi:MAG: AzlD domain-containing protein [Lachnospiraceae bacterium]|nr:AzlD domain-containing protein [Lachnospiraceae bacterium]
MKSHYPVPVSLLIMIVVIYCVRMLPMILLRKNITNPFIRSFLHYVPYVTLAVMTFPAMLYATGSIPCGICALAVGIIASWITQDLFVVAVLCCVSAYIAGFLFI